VGFPFSTVNYLVDNFSENISGPRLLIRNYKFSRIEEGTSPNNILFQNMKLKLYTKYYMLFKKRSRNLDNLSICNNKTIIINVIFFYNFVLQ